jgi:hypothetical protein
MPKRYSGANARALVRVGLKIKLISLMGPLLGFVCVLAILTSFAGPTAKAATPANLNFQARLLNGTGAVVPDGNYNVEFKMYTASSGGSAVWTETRTGSDKVRVVNGYLTVNLGSVTAFGSTMPWDQQLYLTMNIGGTGSPSWDGEMNPRILLSVYRTVTTVGS